MTGAVGKTLWLFIVAIFLLAACNDSNTSQVVEEQGATGEPAAEATSTSQPTATPQPADTPGSTVASVEIDAGEELSASPEFVLGETETYQVESTGLTFDYPAGWVVTEDLPDSILIESEAGCGDRFTTDAGAVIVILHMPPAT